MTAGSRGLRKVQMGRESTAGDAVAATFIWRGLGGMPDDQRTVIFPEEDIGFLSGVDRQYQPRLMGQCTFDDIPATFEHFPHILEAGVQTVAPTSDGSGFVRTYLLATSDQNSIKTYTIEASDNISVEEMEYAFVSDFSLSGVAGEAWNVGATWMGRQWTVSGFTSDLVPASIEEMLFSKTKLYIDPTTDTIGTTLKSQTLLAANINLTTGFIPVFTADGNLYFSFVKQVAPEMTLQITYEHDATSAAEKAAWRAGTPRQIRLLCEGSALGTPGSTYSKKTMIIDMVGKYENFEVLGEQDGNNTVTANFRVRYNTSAALSARFILVNEVATL